MANFAMLTFAAMASIGQNQGLTVPASESIASPQGQPWVCTLLPTYPGCPNA